MIRAIYDLARLDAYTLAETGVAYLPVRFCIEKLFEDPFLLLEGSLVAMSTDRIS